MLSISAAVRLWSVFLLLVTNVFAAEPSPSVSLDKARTTGSIHGINCCRDCTFALLNGRCAGECCSATCLIPSWMACPAKHHYTKLWSLR